jgi:phosphoribosyl-ATP pyrophosphohydrolase
MSLQDAIAAYHVQRFPDCQVEHIALKLAEEAGETCSAVNGHVSGGDYGKGDVVGEAADAVFVALALVGRWFPERDLLAEVEARLARNMDSNGGHRSCVKRSPEVPA